MLTTAPINVAIDRVAYRPLRHAFRLAPLITAIGVSFMLENLALLWKGPAPIAYPDVFPSVDILREWFGMDSLLFITTKDLLVLVGTIPLMIALQYFVTRTRWGKAMRATAQDKETALAMGIDVEKTIILTFFIGGALAGAAGLIQGLYYNIGMWWMGYQAGLRAFTAAVLGGIGSMPRRRARRPRDRLPLRVERPVHLGALDQRDRLLDPDPGPRLPAPGPAGRATVPDKA